MPTRDAGRRGADRAARMPVADESAGTPGGSHGGPAASRRARTLTAGSLPETRPTASRGTGAGQKASGQGWTTDESACTPGSVHGRLAASRWAVIHLGLPLPAGSSGLPAGIGRAALERLRRTAANRRPFLTLLRVGFTEPHRSPGVRWSLTPPFHPYQQRTAGGLFSVALSRGS